MRWRIQRGWTASSCRLQQWHLQYVFYFTIVADFFRSGGSRCFGVNKYKYANRAGTPVISNHSGLSMTPTKTT